MSLKRPVQRRFVLFMTVALALLPGCGGGSSTDKQRERASAAAQSPRDVSAGSQLIAKADPICARLNTAILARESTLPVVNEADRLREIAQVVPGTAALEREAIAKLTRLTPPPSFAGRWSTLLSYRKTLASELDELVRMAKRRDTVAIKGLTKSKKETHGRLRDLALQSGFKDCAEVGPGSAPPPKRSPS